MLFVLSISVVLFLIYIPFLQMVFNYIAKHMFGYDDSENTSEDKISEKFTKISEFLMSIPLNVPGTTYHKCLKVL